MDDADGGSTDGGGSDRDPGSEDRSASEDGADEEAVERALGRAWLDAAPWTLLTQLSALDRFGGHPGEAAAADLLSEVFEDAGLRDVRQEPFGMRRWTRGGTELTVDTGRGERAFEALALPYSPAAAVRGPIVDVGHGAADAFEDVEGAVAVADVETPPAVGRRVHRMETVGHAADAGAAAVLFVGGRPGQLPPTGALRFGERAPLPAAGVSAETGAWLREYAGRPADLRIDASTGDGESRNVRARLGPETGEAVLLVAHYDAHDVGEGALDNGCGVAVVLGAVRALADLDLDCGVEVAAVGCEELGLLGSEALADRLDRDRLRAVVNVDGAGRFRELRAYTHGSDAGRVVASVADRVDHPIETEPDPHPYSDHWPFLRAGVPAVQLHSAPDGAGRWERGYTHTRADTREKVDARTLREHAMLAALLVRALTRQSVTVSADEVRRRLVEAGAEPGMRAARIWPDGWE